MKNGKQFLTRRSFLKALGAATLAAGCPTILPQSAKALVTPVRRTNKKVLIHVFLSGGLDGLSSLIPTNVQDAYKSQRNTDFVTSAFTPDSNTPNLRSLIVPGVTQYTFHPKLSFLAGLLNKNQLATPFKMGIFNFVGHVPRTGAPGHSGSHAEASNMYERGAVLGASVTGGWLGRFADTICDPADPFSLVSFRGICGDGKGKKISPLSVSPGVYASGKSVSYTTGLEQVDIASFKSISGDNLASQFADGISKMQSAETPNNQASDSLSKIWPHAGEIIREVWDIRLQPNFYAYTSDALGTQFEGASQLLRAGYNPAAIMIKQDGYDHHQELVNGLSYNLASLNANLESLCAELVDMGRAEDVIILIETEFGRRNYMNSAQGCDHGGGALTFVIGTGIQHGIFSRPYAAADLTSKINLPEEIDFREIRAQILRGHFGMSAKDISATIFPTEGGQLPYKASGYDKALFNI